MILEVSIEWNRIRIYRKIYIEIYVDLGVQGLAAQHWASQRCEGVME
jgi:hypothetical protein